MATIRSYTSLEQSKKLAEILPLESADQTWARIAIAGANLDVPEELQYRHNGDMPFKYYSGICTPCWSLASLVGVLPDELEDNHFLTLQKEKNEYCCCYEDINGNSFRHTFADNPVDACVAMIEKLNELKFL